MADRKAMLVTGAAGSLGSALSRQASARGFHVVMLDRDQRGLERVYDEIARDDSADPIMQVTDLAVAGPGEYNELLAAITREFGRLDALVHCAARFDCLAPLEHIPPNEWLMAMQVNVNAAWLLSSLALPLLRESGAGHLYFLLEDLPRVGGPLWGPYGVSKHALSGLVNQFAGECQTSGVRVLGINPGPMQSPLRSRAYLAERPDTQPAPGAAAEKILDLIEGHAEASGVYLDLSRPQ